MKYVENKMTTTGTRMVARKEERKKLTIWHSKVSIWNIVKRYDTNTRNQLMKTHFWHFSLSSDCCLFIYEMNRHFITGPPRVFFCVFHAYSKCESAARFKTSTKATIVIVSAYFGRWILLRLLSSWSIWIHSFIYLFISLFWFTNFGTWDIFFWHFIFRFFV